MYPTAFDSMNMRMVVGATLRGRPQHAVLPSHDLIVLLLE